MDLLHYRQMPNGGHPLLDGVLRLYAMGAVALVGETATEHAFDRDVAVTSLYCVDEPQDSSTLLEARIAGRIVFSAPLIALHQAFGARRPPAAEIVEEGLRICLASLTARTVIGKLEEKEREGNVGGGKPKTAAKLTPAEEIALADLRAIDRVISAGGIKIPVAVMSKEPLALRLVSARAHRPVTIAIFGIARESVI